MEKIIVNKDYKELHSLISIIFKDDSETEVVIERRVSDKAYNYNIERPIFADYVSKYNHIEKR